MKILVFKDGFDSTVEDIVLALRQLECYSKVSYNSRDKSLINEGKTLWKFVEHGKDYMAVDFGQNVRIDYVLRRQLRYEEKILFQSGKIRSEHEIDREKAEDVLSKRAKASGAEWFTELGAVRLYWESGNALVAESYGNKGYVAALRLMQYIGNTDEA